MCKDWLADRTTSQNLKVCQATLFKEIIGLLILFAHRKNLLPESGAVGINLT
jgi:hypothetical protein